MEREYKFRAFDKSDGRILNVVEPKEQGKREYYPFEVQVGFSHYNKEDVILMQWTGLKDTDGVEVYEDDFLKDDIGRIWLVSWNPHDCKFVKILQQKKPKFDGRIGQLQSALQDYTTVLMKVVGNRFQNPELLKT